MDSAFFSDANITSLDAQGVEYAVSVPFGTGSVAEDTAVGFNRKKKGQRSYYPQR